MILHALAEHYEALRLKDSVPPPCWNVGKVSFALSLREDGTLLQIIPMLVEKTFGEKTVLRPREMRVPDFDQRTVGFEAYFLCDNATFLLCIDSKGNPVRARKSFEAAKELHIRLLKDVDCPAARAIVSFFESWQPKVAQEHPALAEVLPQLKEGGNLVFRIDGDFAQDAPAIREAWQREYNSLDSEIAPATCLVTGKAAPPMRRHPVIKGVLGAQSSGASLVSFNAEAYNSYGKTQGLNAQVSREATAAYGKALNYLLADREHMVRFGDTTVVFWAEGGQSAPQGMMACALDDRGVGENELRAAIERLANGKTARWEDEEISPDTQFYILGLGPNAARLSVRFFLRDRLGVLAKRLLEHQNRLEIVRPKEDSREQLSFPELLSETINQKLKVKKPPHGLDSELIRSVFTGAYYPAVLLNSVMLRIRAERNITRGRAAIIKAYYLKNKHLDCPEEVLTVSLNEESKNPAYCLGQLFSVLEGIQAAANPKINATIRDKYFSSASTRPSSVFPTLVDLAQKHLRKIDVKLRIYYEKELGKIFDKLPDFPVRLSLQQQGDFQIGYYHMTQKRYTKKEEE